MGVVRRSEGILTRFFVVGLLVQTFQNTFADGKGTRGPRELLISRNRPQSIQPSEMRSSEYFKTGVPDYLLRLRERHSKEWMNFGQAEGGHGPNLGIITSIRHHWNVEPKGRRSKWQRQQNLNFRLARFSSDEHLIAGSLRLPFRGYTNTTIPVHVRVAGVGEVVKGTVYVESTESKQRVWFNVPLSPASLHTLLRGRRLLRLRVDLTDTSAIDTSDAPHLLTFHRNRKYMEMLKRVRRAADDKVQTAELEQTGDETETLGGDQKKRRRALKNGKREKRSPRYLMNQRYVASTCQRRDLMVNFNAVGWSRWVIAPTVYNAGYCYGYCPFPLSAHFNTTNHAIIIHLMYKLRVAPPQVNPPCCIPLTFSPQSILFFDGDEVVLQVYEDMIVETCGCR